MSYRGAIDCQTFSNTLKVTPVIRPKNAKMVGGWETHKTRLSSRSLDFFIHNGERKTETLRELQLSSSICGGGDTCGNRRKTLLAVACCTVEGRRKAASGMLYAKNREMYVRKVEKEAGRKKEEGGAHREIGCGREGFRKKEGKHPKPRLTAPRQY